MKKDFTIDYVTAAFCMWACHNCRTYDEEVAEITKRARNRAAYVDPQKLHGFIDAEITNRHSELADIAACAETFRLLEKGGEKEICDAIRAVYMATPHRVPRRQEISGRVLAYALDVPVSERTVYRWLRKGRKMFCALRGLRYDDK